MRRLQARTVICKNAILTGFSAKSVRESAGIARARVFAGAGFSPGRPAALSCPAVGNPV